MNYTRLVLPFVSLLALVVIGKPVLAVAQSATLIHRTDREVTYEVTSNGLSRIAVQGRALATGEWSVFNAESWVSRGATNAERPAMGTENVSG